MTHNILGFLAFAFVGMTIVNRVLEGAFITAADVGILNTMTITQKVDVGLFSIPVLNLDFFKGITRLVLWDYSFFGGNAQIIQFFLYSFTFVLSFILFTIIIALLYNAFSRLR